MQLPTPNLQLDVSAWKAPIPSILSSERSLAKLTAGFVIFCSTCQDEARPPSGERGA
jgi:hypothetical protein